MEQLEVADVQLSYEPVGQGEPVVLVHASPFVSWYDPLRPHLDGYAVLQYRRAVRPSPDGSHRPLSVAEDAGLCRQLMDHVGWRRAHLVGHSYGALVALGLAGGAPDRVASLALLEPAARGIRSAAAVVAALQPVIAAYRAGDRAAAVDGFLQTVCGPDYRATLDRVLPKAFDDAVAYADHFFQAEMPAVQQFGFGPDDARAVRQPVLNVVGGATAPRFVEGAELVQSWFPDAERFTLPGATHLLMVQDPAGMAAALRGFFARHPIGR
jgi:pimeloyl-ACP methyl ester carboxylesterase